MKTVDVYNMLWFHCPRCERANFIREVFVQRGDTLVLEPVRSCVCEHCTYVLTKQESRPSRGDGGESCSRGGSPATSARSTTWRPGPFTVTAGFRL